MQQLRIVVTRRGGYGGEEGTVMKVALALVLPRWPAFGHIELIHVVRATLIKPRNVVSLNPRRMQDEPSAKDEAKGGGKANRKSRHAFNA